MNLTYFFIVFLFGIVIGSFTNAFVWRTQKHKTMNGRSMCPKCNKTIFAKDLIPILSFIILRGKCRNCKAKISIQYPLVETWFGIAFVCAALIHQSGFYDFSIELLRDWFIIFILSFLFIYDYLYKELPDKITLPSIGILFVLSLIFGWHTWQSMLIGAVVLGGFFLFQFAISRGKWIGGGDIRLGVLMGIILGWPLAIVALMLSYVGGAFLSVILLALKRTSLESQTPFGTYLAVATLFTMFWGYNLLDWYLGLIF
ncbi:MAG: prepilin peptidase [Candidatus Magasanikbacteria bacterium]|nr:prepilin peptidase [Candidatus Magasanikbacteria bacterium]